MYNLITAISTHHLEYITCVGVVLALLAVLLDCMNVAIVLRRRFRPDHTLSGVYSVQPFLYVSGFVILSLIVTVSRVTEPSTFTFPLIGFGFASLFAHFAIVALYSHGRPSR